MSASGAIAAALAFQRAMGLPHEESLRRSYSLAHRAERERSTGLGDVTALAAGGAEQQRTVVGSACGEPAFNATGSQCSHVTQSARALTLSTVSQ